MNRRTLVIAISGVAAALVLIVLWFVSPRRDAQHAQQPQAPRFFPHSVAADSISSGGQISLLDQLSETSREAVLQHSFAAHRSNRRRRRARQPRRGGNATNACLLQKLQDLEGVPNATFLMSSSSSGDDESQPRKHYPLLDDDPSLFADDAIFLADLRARRSPEERHPLFPNGAAKPFPAHKPDSGALQGLAEQMQWTPRQRAVQNEFLVAWYAFLRRAGIQHDVVVHAQDDGDDFSPCFSDWGMSLESTPACDCSSDDDNDEEEDGGTVNGSRSRGRGRGSSGLALTAIEAVSTMWLMGFKREVARVVRFLKQTRSDGTTPRHSFDRDVYVSFFETTIRLLGGLLSAYELTAQEIFLTKAHDLGVRLLRAFPSSANASAPVASCGGGAGCGGVFPRRDVNLRTGHARNEHSLHGLQFVAEVSSFQLEFVKLSHWTGDGRFEAAAAAVNAALVEMSSRVRKPGGAAMFPPFVDTAESGSGAKSKTGQRGSSAVASLGAGQDSFYEYVVKQQRLLPIRNSRNGAAGAHQQQQQREALAEMWREHLRPSIHRNLLVQINATHALLGQQRVSSSPSSSSPSPSTAHTMDHLSCFAPGMFLLGLDSADAPAAALAIYRQVFGGSSSSPSASSSQADEATEAAQQRRRLFAAILAENSEDSRSARRQRELLRQDVLDIKLAHDVAATCHAMYAATATGLAPEIVHFSTATRRRREARTAAMMTTTMHSLPRERYNIGRPEAVESFFYMFRFTQGDSVWQERGWDVFTAMRRHLRFHRSGGGWGYGGVLDVEEPDPRRQRRVHAMQSFFLSETLKYLFLLFEDAAEEQQVPLAAWVFNTEGHPMRRL